MIGKISDNPSMNMNQSESKDNGITEFYYDRDEHKAVGSSFEMNSFEVAKHPSIPGKGDHLTSETK